MSDVILCTVILFEFLQIKILKSKFISSLFCKNSLWSLLLIVKNGSIHVKLEFELSRNKIYEEEIHYAFFKLTQNIIHTFKFYHTEVEDLEHLQHEIIVFLLSKIHLFNPENGAKAYSYFGTIVKRWLILYNEKNYKKKVQKSSVEDLEKDENHSYTLEGGPSKDKLSNFIDTYLHNVGI